MQIIKLNATDSTNSYLKNLINNKLLDDYTVVVAKKQIDGRGQMGTTWVSDEGKNLTFSTLKLIDSLPVKDQFLLNIIISLAVFDALLELNVPDLKVKWPNDILSGNDKICGILIENLLSGVKIQSSVIGIGLNVNQTEFNELPNVSSLKLLLGNNFDLDEIMIAIVRSLKNRCQFFENGSKEKLWSEYENVLFRKDKPSTFQNQNNEMIMGFIRGVTAEGRLLVALEGDLIQEFNLKEIKLLY